MAHKKLQATAELFLNTKNAKKDAQIFIDGLKQKLTDIESAADKMTVFKDMVGYIAQVDKALAALRANNKNAFNSMFDGLDVNLKKQLEGIFGIDGAKLGKLNVLRDTLNNLTPQSTIKEIREFAKSLNEIYESIGSASPFSDIESEFKEFSKEAKAKHIEKLSTQLSNFATVWKNVNSQISKGFGIGGRGFGGFSGLNKEVQNEIDKLKEQEKEINEIIDAINNPKKVKVTLLTQSDKQVEQLKNLKDEFIAATDAKKKFEANNMTGSTEYLNAVGKYIQSAAKLKSAFESTKLTKAGNNWIMASGIGALQEADNVIDKFLVQNKDLITKVSTMYSDKIKDIVRQMASVGKTDAILDGYNADVNLNRADDIIKDSEETVAAIEYATKELTKAWQKYYRAAQKAANDYDLILEDGETSPEMDRIKASIDAKLDSWGIMAKNPSKWGPKVDLDLADAIADGDINASGIERELDKLIKQHGISFNIPVTDLKIDDSTLTSTDTALDRTEDKIDSVHGSFQDLVNYISQSGISPGKFFNKIEDGAQRVDEELKNILQSLGLIDTNGNIDLSSITSGYTNKGGFVSDQYTMIARPITGPSGQKYLQKSENLQVRLAEAQKTGAQIGAIFDIIKDEANGLFYEIQNTVPGTAAFSHQSKSVNANVLSASNKQFRDLIHTIKALTEQKLFIDFGGDNILYDKDKGFSIIDLGLVGDQYHTVSGQNTLQENLDRFIKEYFKFAPSSMKADVQTMLADKLYEVANSIDPHVINPNATSKQDAINSSKDVVSSIKSEEVAHDKNTDAIDKEAAALEALVALKEKAQNMKWKDFAKDESLAGLKDMAGFSSVSQLEKFWKQARYEKQINFHEISEKEAKQIFSNKLTPGLANEWYGGQNFAVKDQLENEILGDDEIRNAALSYMYHLYKNWLPSQHKNLNVKSFKDFLNTQFTVYRGDDNPLIYGDESKLSFSFNPEKTQGFDNKQGTVQVMPKYTIGNAGSHYEGEVEIFGMKASDTSWFKETGETFEQFYGKQTKEMQDEIDAGLVNLEKRRIRDLLDENIGKLTHKAGKEAAFTDWFLPQFQNGIVPAGLMGDGQGGALDQFVLAYNALSKTDKKLVAYYANLEAISKSLPKQLSIAGGVESSKDIVGEDAKLFNAILNDTSGVQKHVNKITGESKFGILGKNAQDIDVEANMHKLHAQTMEEEQKAQEALNKEKEKAARMWAGVSDKLHSDADGKDSYLVREISDVWDGAKSVFDAASGKYSGQDLINSGGYVNHLTGEVQKVKDLINKIDDIMEKTGVDLSYVQDYLSEIYKNSDLDGLDKELSSIMIAAPSTDYDSVSSQLERLVKSKQGGTDEFDKLASVFHAIKDIDTTSKSNNADWLINDGKYMSDLTNVPLDVSDLYEVIDNIEQRYGENLQYVKDYLNKIYQSNTANELGSLFDDDLLIEDLDFTLPLDDNENFKKAYSKVLDELIMADGEKVEKLAELQGHLADLKTTDTDVIDIGYIQKSINGKVATIESVYALIDEIQQSYETDLTDVKNVLDEIFSTYNKNTSSSSQIKDVKPIEYQEVSDLLYIAKESAQMAGKHGEQADLASLYDLIFDVALSTDDVINQGKFSDAISGQATSIQKIYDFIHYIQNEYQVNLEKVEKWLDQVYKNYHENPFDTDSLYGNISDDFSVDENGQTLAFQSKKYSVQDYEDMYGTQNASAQAAMNEMAVFYTEYVKLKEKIQQDPIEFLISPENATPDEIKQVQQALEKFKAIQKEITNMPLVETDDDLAKLQDLQAEAVGLQNYLRGAVLSKNSPIGYDEAFNLSDFDATALHAITSIPSVNNIEQELDSAYNMIGDKMYNAIDDDFSVMIVEDMTNSLHDYLLQLGNQLKIEQQITAEKEQQKILTDHGTQTGAGHVLGSGIGVYQGVDGGYALESTLQQTNGILNNILTAASTNDNVGFGGYKQSQKQISDPEDVFKTNLSDKTKLFDAYKNGLEGVEYVTDSLRTELDGLDAQLQNIANQSDLDAWAKQFNVLKDNIKASQSVFEQQNLGKINLYQKSLTNSYNKLTLPQQEELYDDYIKIIALLNKQKQSVEDGHAVELAGIKQITAALQEEIDKRIEANKVAKDAEKTQKKNSKFGDTAMINATAKYNKLSSIATSEFADSKVVSEALADYSNAYIEMQTTRDKLNNKEGEITSSDEAEFKAAKDECNEYAKALEKLIKKSMELHNSKANPDDYMLGADFVDDKQGRINALTDFAKQMYGVKLAATDFKDDWNKAVFSVKNGDGTFTQMTATFTEARNEIVAMAGDTKRSVGLMGQLWDQYKGKLKSVFSYALASVSIYDVWRVIKQGVGYVKEIDSALTELKKVTDETDASYTKFLKDMSKTGSVVGATVKNLTIMAAEWARLGYSMEEAGKLARSTAILLNVSEFEDATKASEALISTMQAFQYTADESVRVVDILNEVGNNYAVSSDGIATALQDSASALMAAGNNLEQAVALVASANRVVQDPNSVGSALRTISLRLRGTSVEILEEMGEETEGVIESTSKLQSKIQALSGVNILTNSGDYKDTYTILKEIGTVWEDMSDIDQAALLELMAGKNRANTLSAILSNMEDLEGAYESALDAEGSALKENEAYLNSIQGRIDLFNNSLQTVWMNLIDSNAIKAIVDWGTRIIKSLDTIPGKILAIVKALALFMAVKKINPFESIANTINLLKTDGIGATFKNLAGTLFGVTTAMKAVTAETIANTIATQTNDAAQTKQIMTELGLAGATGTLDAAQKQAIATKILDMMATNDLSMSQGNAMLAMLGYAGATMTADGSLKVLDATTKSFMATNPIGWILLIVSAIMSVVMWLSQIPSKIEKLTEELDDIKSQLRDINSEIESINSELETTNDRMAELLAKDKLSFTEEEELDNLRKQNDELQRRLDLLDLERKQKNRESAEKFNSIMQKDIGLDIWKGMTWENGEQKPVEYVTVFDKNGNEKFTGKNNSWGAFWNELWYEGILGDGVGTGRKFLSETEYLDKQISDYNNASDEEKKEIEKIINGKFDEWKKAAEGLDYGIDEETDKWLDFIYNYQDKWAIASGGANAKTNALNRIFNKDENDEISDAIDDYVKALQNGDTSAKQSIENIIGNNKDLVEDLEASGLSIDDAVAYFTQLGSSMNFGTVEGKNTELTRASEQFKAILDAYNNETGISIINADGVEEEVIAFADIFDKNGNIIEEKISKLFEGTSEETRKGVSNIIKALNDKRYDTEDALKAFEIMATEQMLVITNALIVDQNKDLFGNVDGIDGIIDTFKELAVAVGSVSDAMNTLEQAQKEFNHSGYVSIETALKLIEYTDDYSKVLEIDEFGAIKLVKDAQKTLIEEKLSLIRTNAQQAVSEAEVAVEQATLAYNTAVAADSQGAFVDAVQTHTIATLSALAGGIAWVGAAIKALFNGEDVIAAGNAAFSAAYKSPEQQKQDKKDNVAATQLALSEAENNLEKAKANQRLANALTVDNLNEMYSSDDADGSGDSTTELDWIDNYFTKIENEIKKKEAELENVTASGEGGLNKKNTVIDEIIGLYEGKMSPLETAMNAYKDRASALFNGFSSDIQGKILNGSIDISEYDGDLAEDIQNYFDYITSASDLEIEIGGIKATVTGLEIQQVDNAYDSGSVRAAVEASQTEKLQNAVDFDEARGLITDPNYYAAMMENSSKTVEYLTKARNNMQKEFDDMLRAGKFTNDDGSYNDLFYQEIDKLYKIDSEIAKAIIELENFQNAINDIYWENFDELINRFDYISEETKGLIDLMSSEDMIIKPDTEDGWDANDVTWSDEGLATLGLHAQEMERAEEKAKMYGIAIADLTAEYEAGHYSESEYHEKLNELTQGQYDAIKAAQDEKDAIVELNKQRVDAIKDGIEKEIDAYDELIKKKKEELSAEKDLYDFQRETTEKQKDISDIERKLAALANDNSMSAVAKRKQLEAELAEAKSDLEDSYYNRSIDNQQEALDKELDNFKEQKEAEKEQWDKYLEDIETIVAESLAVVKTNADAIGKTLTEKSSEYGVTVSDAVLKPWTDGLGAIDSYTKKIGDSISPTVQALEPLREKWQKIKEELAAANAEADKYYNKNQATADGPSVDEINAENKDYHTVLMQATLAQTTSTTPNTTTTSEASNKPSLSKGSSVTVKKTATHFSAHSDNKQMKSYVPGGTYTVYETDGDQVLIGRNGAYTGWIKKTDIEGFYKGTTGTNKNQLAWIDELGEELVMHANGSGKLTYLTKGSAVIPHDISENLMQLGQLDPSTVLEQNRPKIAPSKSIINTEIRLDCSVGTMVNIEHCDQNTLPDVEKLVNKAFDKQMQTLNNSIRKFAR